MERSCKMEMSADGSASREFLSSDQCRSPNTKQKATEKAPWEDVDPILVSKEEYLDIFGSSSDEETEFYGFSEKELGLKEFKNVISPNKLKLQDDFYMPLFLSHRKRNRGLVHEKPQENQQEVKRDFESKNPISIAKQSKSKTQSSQEPSHSISKLEFENPYAKQYKSYRRDRTKSVPIAKTIDAHPKKTTNDVVEAGVKVDFSFKKEPERNEAAGDCKTTSSEKSDLKMKIQYQSHFRPKRKVIVQEKDDFVYGITLPSKKRARTLSPTVITNVKILKTAEESITAEPSEKEDLELLDKVESPKEETSAESTVVAAVEFPKERPEEAVEIQNEDPLLQKQNNETSFDVKSKRKKRFKNFRGTETEYMQAVFEEVMNLKEEVPDMADTSSQLAPGESDKDQLVIENESSALASNDVIVEKHEGSPKEIVNSDMGDLSQQVKTPDRFHEAERVKEDSASTVMNENIVELNKKNGASVKEKCVAEAKTQGRRRSRLQKAKREVEDSTAPSNITEKKKERSIIATEELSKDTGTNITREVQRKERTAASFKPKDINLTDSWFIAASTARKRSGNSDKSKSISKNASENASARTSVKNSSSNANVASEDSHKVKAPAVGKFVPVEKRTSMTRKRRIKNVSVNGMLSGDSYGVVSGDSQAECLAERSSTDCGNSNSQEESGENLQSVDDRSNLSPSLSHPSKEDSEKAPIKLSETGNFPEVTVAVTRLSELKLVEHSASRRADVNILTVTDTQNNPSWDMTQNVAQQQDFGVFDSSQTNSNKSSRPVDGNSSGSDEIVNVGGSIDVAVSEKSSPRASVRGEVLPAKKAVEKARNEFTDSSSKIEVKFSMPVEVIEVRSLGGSSSKTDEKDHCTKLDEKDLTSGGQEELANDASSNLVQERQLEDGSNDKPLVGTSSEDEKSSKEREAENSQFVGRKLNRRFSKSNGKDLKKVKSGKSFIIKTPVNNAEKQVTVRPMKSNTRRASKGLNDNESDTDIDITALNKDNDAGKEDAGKDAKVKRKIYTVVRKIRRTEISADGKKVTKIIKQIVKKVCPVTNELPVAAEKKKDTTTEKQSKDPDIVSDKPVEDKPEKVVSIKPKSTLRRKCGRCNGCLRKEDCKKCDACSKKKLALPRKLNILCRLRQCREKGKKFEAISKSEGRNEKADTQKKPATKTITIAPSRDEISLKSLIKSNPTSAAPAKLVKPKAKSKGTKTGLKDLELNDDVYAPGFRLRSMKSEVVKTKPERILKEVKYCGLEPKVKLPWPEEQDEQSICNSGSFFCVTSPIDIATKDICFHCGSGGFSKMITCINCGEVYHEFCIEIDPLDENRWFCDRCKRCNVCGYKDNLLMCDKCHDCYHAECLGPSYHKETEGVDDLWVCAKCVKCEKCGARVPGKRKESKWMRDFTLCEECNWKMERGQYCLICGNVYAENDYDTQMMYCTSCCNWVHMECEGLNSDEYECLAELPDEIPYICKLCHDSEVWPRWYQEVREEIQAGFEKTYYEIIGSSDMKIVNRHLPDFKTSEAQRILGDSFKRIQEHKFKTVEQFVSSMQMFIEHLSKMIDGVLPNQITQDLKSLLRKQVKSMFSWTEELFKKPKNSDLKTEAILKTFLPRPEIPEATLNAIFLDHSYNQPEPESNLLRKEDSGKDDIEVASIDSIASETLLCKEKCLPEYPAEGSISENDTSRIPSPVCNAALVSAEGGGRTICPDQKPDEDNRSDLASEKYDALDCDDLVSSSMNSLNDGDDENSQDGENSSLHGKIRTAKHVDDRRCLLCSQYGDEHEKDSGRILTAGVNEWVHVNCALWSAEVYENDAGLLQNVHVAISRGQKLQCSSCQQWGATVGCCTSSCPSNYHFMCARNAAVIFQNDKLVYCPKHKHKSKNEVILEDGGFVVERPVMVDLSKVSNQKKFAVDRDPDSINIYSGSIIIHRLGRLTESSNGNDVLVPIGYRATRLFWSSTNTSKRCKYSISIDEIPAETKSTEDEEDIVLGGMTIPHNVKQLKRKEMALSDETLWSLQKKQKISTSQTKMKSPSVSTLSVPVGSPPASSVVIGSRPFKFCKDTFTTKHFEVENSGPNKLSYSSSVTQDVEMRNTCAASQPTLKKQSSVFYHKSSPHKIIPQPRSLPTTYDLPFNVMMPTHMSSKPRLIQPKLRYEVVPTVLQPDVSGSNTKRPILPKYDPPVVSIARHVQYHLNSNPQIINYVGDATLQGLHQVLGNAYQYPISPMPLHVDPSCNILPCYTLNLPEVFWRTYAGQPQISPSSHHFPVQKSPHIISNRTTTDFCCQTDVEENNQTQNICVRNKETNVPSKQPNFNQNFPQTKRKLDMNVTAGLERISFVSDSSSTTINALRKNETIRPCTRNSDAYSSSDCQQRLDSNSIEITVEDLCTSPADNKLPNMRNLIDSIKENDATLHTSIYSDHVSPLSLQNISELSCLQAAAQLAKLMPEIFDEKRTTAYSLERDNSCSFDSLKDNHVDAHVIDVTTSSVGSTPEGGKPEVKRNRKWYQKRMKKLLGSDKQQNSRLRVTVKNEDGMIFKSSSIQGIWKEILDKLNEMRIDQKLPPLLFNESEAFEFFGLAKFPTSYIAEQLPGGHKCRSYKFQFHLPCTSDEDKELPLNPHGCARADFYPRKQHSDMFAWLASPYRTLPQYDDEGDDTETNKTASDLPLSMRFRQLKNKVKDHVGVYRSPIDGRGLFCKRQIEASEMVIEYAGSVIRATLTDKRENYYEGKGYGCYMFRIDDTFVVDATLYGNEARFINHSCEPNCYSRIVSVDGEKHIVIFAGRRIFPGEELTYDYKFPFEEEKIPCHCGSKKCRKYLN